MLSPEPRAPARKRDETKLAAHGLQVPIELSRSHVRVDTERGHRPWRVATSNERRRPAGLGNRREGDHVVPHTLWRRVDLDRRANFVEWRPIASGVPRKSGVPYSPSAVMLRNTIDSPTPMPTPMPRSPSPSSVCSGRRIVSVEPQTASAARTRMVKEARSPPGHSARVPTDARSRAWPGHSHREIWRRPGPSPRRDRCGGRPRGRTEGAYCTALIMSKMGRYIATTMPPTTTPRNTIITGSRSESKPETAASTSSS